MAGKIGGPPQKIPTQYKDSDGFADDAAAAQKAKTKDGQKSVRDTHQKSRAKELAAQVQKVQQSQFTSEADAKARQLGKSGNQDSSKITRDPKQQSRGQGAPAGKALTSAAKQLGSIATLLSQLADAIDAADVMAGSFADDKLAAQLMGKKSNKERAAKERQAADAKANAQKDLEKLAQSTETQSDSENETAPPTVDSSPGADLGQSGTDVKALSRGLGMVESGSTSEELVEALHTKAAALIDLGATLDAHIDRSGLDSTVADLQDVTALVEEAHNKFKGLLVPLLSGEFGPLRRDPYDQFQGLFEQVEQWPGTIPPGKVCEKNEEGELSWTRENWDAFISWLVAPNSAPSELESTLDLLNTIS